MNTKSDIKEFELDNSVFICEFIKDDEIVEFLLKNGMNVKDNTWNYWNLSNNSYSDNATGFPMDYWFYKKRLKLVQKYGAHSGIDFRKFFSTNIILVWHIMES